MAVVEAPNPAVAQVAEQFMQRAGESEQLRTMPPDLVAQAKQAGLFRLAMPKALGGLEADPLSTFTTIEELCRADGSAGWTVLIGNSTAFFAWLDHAVARSMLSGTSDVVSTSMFAPMGRARREGGELVISGRWPFNSGCRHAEWYQAAVHVMDGDRIATRSDGRPDMRFAYFRREDACIIDTWHSMGLRGTGSDDITVDGLRIPVEQTAAPMLDGARQEGTVWRLGFFTLLGVLMAGFPLGVARRALDELAVLAPTKRRGTSPHTVASDAHVQHEVGRAEAAVRSARAFAIDAIGDAWDTACVGDGLSPEQQGRVLLASQQAMEAAITAVGIAFRFAGAGAVYSGHPLERCFRDIHTAGQHIGFSGEAFRASARQAFGVEG